MDDLPMTINVRTQVDRLKINRTNEILTFKIQNAKIKIHQIVNIKNLF